MKPILLNNGRTLQLPEDWNDLRPADRLTAFGWLLEMLEGRMTPFEWQLRLLLLITGYRPSRRKRTPEQQDNIQTNLIRLAEQLDFAFSVDDDNHIRLNAMMRDCPVKANAQFHRDRIIDTNITARQYADALDLLRLIRNADNTDDADFYRLRLCRLLGAELPPKQADVIPRFVELWFTGVAQFFALHPVYRVLFPTNNSTNSTAFNNSTDSSDQIDLGMQEVILYLKTQGFADADRMLLPEFFDAQLKLLQDNLRDAKAQGLTIADLMQRTSLSAADINRLL